MGDQHKDEFFW